MIQLYWLIAAIGGLFTITAFAADKTKSTYQHSTNNTYEYRLQNGLKLVVREDHRAPVVVSSIWYRVGGSYEHDGITGISHMLEHMMFKGTKRFPPGQLIKVVSDNGGQQNAMTSADFTLYYQKLAADKLSLSFELESDRMKNLLWQKSAYDKEHQVVMEERRMRTDDNPQGVTWERFNAVAFLNNPYHHPVIGWMSDIRHLTLSDLKQWYRTWYAPNNAIVVVVGDVKAAQVFNLAKKYFGSIKAVHLPKLKPRRQVSLVGQRKIWVNVPAKVPWLVIGYNVPVLNTAKQQWQAYALYMLLRVLDSGSSGRLSTALVRGKQLAARVQGQYDIYSLYDNLLVIDAVPASGRSIDSLYRAVMDEVKRLRTTLVSATELARIRTQVLAETIYKKDSIMRQVFDIGIPEIVELSWRDSEAFISRINAVTPQQIQAVARQFLVPSNSTLAILQPKSLLKK